MEHTSRCTGESRASQCPVDLTNVLNDAAALQQLVVALFGPFEQMHVDQVVALLVDETSRDKQETTAARPSPVKEKNQMHHEAVDPVDAVSMPLHRFTTAIAGAIAGAKQLGELPQLAGIDNSSNEVTEIMKNAFARCDEELKQSLMALSPEIRMSKGYCNAGSCAVVALFINTALYVANVGDCAAVLGRVSKETGGLQAVEVSVDHSCNNVQEARLVVERSRDRNAIRLSKDDQANGSNGFGVKRVAGSLAITRAFGDFYLKCEELSSAPFKSKVPYITAEPSITTVYMDGSEKFVILASDGLWEVMTAEEAAHIVDKFDPGQSLFFSTASAALIHATLEKIAHRDGLMIHELMAMTQGPARRRFHDDITCTVVYIDHDQSFQQQAIDRREGDDKSVV
ncbi:hypothetical protein BBJ28_00011330 [Nothophytophthora sp. Chile5]|nr:hypothetical protein BBJ28_00011330 [Nothophytophthora sp. Chile5]